MMSEHLDADTVAALAARALSMQERSRVFEHLASCEHCREWVAVNAEGRRSFTLPNWCLLAAAGVACAFFAGWLMSAHPVGERVSGEMPEAWKHIRVAPDVLPARPANQVSIQTTVGERWIAVDGFWDAPGR